MRLFLIVMMTAGAALAETPKEAPQPETIESLKAQVAALNAEIAAKDLQSAYQLQICQDPQLMQLKLQAISARQAADAAAKPKPKDPVRP